MREGNRTTSRPTASNLVPLADADRSWRCPGPRADVAGSTGAVPLPTVLPADEPVVPRVLARAGRAR